MGDIIDKPDKFKQPSDYTLKNEWIVVMPIDVSWSLLWKVIYCLVTGKHLTMQQTFSENPVKRKSQ